MPAEVHCPAQGVIDTPRPRPAAAGTDELPVAVPRRLLQGLCPRALVRDGRAVVEREQGGHRRVVLERPVRRSPAARIDFHNFRARDHAHEIDVMDRHIQQIRVRHPATPVTA